MKCPILEKLGKGCAVASLLLLLSTLAYPQEVIEPAVEIAARGADPAQELALIIGFADDVDVQDESLQRALADLGASDTLVLTIINSIAATVPAGSLADLAAIAGVVDIRLDEEISIPSPPTPPDPAVNRQRRRL